MENTCIWVAEVLLCEWTRDYAEEHELKGEHHKCHECPHCVRDLNRFGDIDARKVWATCAKTGKRTRINLDVCDIFYEERG